MKTVLSEQVGQVRLHPAAASSFFGPHTLYSRVCCCRNISFSLFIFAFLCFCLFFVTFFGPHTLYSRVCGRTFSFLSCCQLALQKNHTLCTVESAFCLFVSWSDKTVNIFDHTLCTVESAAEIFLFVLLSFCQLKLKTDFIRPYSSHHPTSCHH